MKPINFAAAALCTALMSSPASEGGNRPSLFGIELGSPVALSRCPIDTIGGLFGSGGTEFVKDHSDMCWGPPQFTFDRHPATPQTLPANGDVGIYFAAMRVPSYAERASFDVSLRNGVVFQMRMWAGETKNQKEVLDTLAGKFGIPNNSDKKTISNSFGATSDLFNAEWHLSSGDVVKYEGYLNNYRVGSIWVMTPEAAQAEAVRRAQFAAPKM